MRRRLRVRRAGAMINSSIRGTERRRRRNPNRSRHRFGCRHRTSGARRGRPSRPCSSNRSPPCSLRLWGNAGSLGDRRNRLPFHCRFARRQNRSAACTHHPCTHLESSLCWSGKRSWDRRGDMGRHSSSRFPRGLDPIDCSHNAFGRKPPRRTRSHRRRRSYYLCKRRTRRYSKPLSPSPDT
jgi:hypothetical protein